MLKTDFKEIDYVKRLYNIFKPYESILFYIPVSKDYSFDAPTRTFSEYVSPVYSTIRNTYRRCRWLVADYDLDDAQRALYTEWKKAETSKLAEFYKTFDKKRLRNDMYYLSKIYSN